MLNYKQIWHGIKPIRWLNKFNLTRTLGSNQRKEERQALDNNGNTQGWQWGGARPKNGVFHPTWLSYPIPTPPHMTGKTFSPHPRPLEPREAPSHPIKLYFLLICPKTSTIFLMKPISLIKIYLKLQLNLSHQIKSIFRRKKMNNISKCQS